MPFTFGQLKSETRKLVFPSGEAANLVTAHDKFMLDGLLDCQRWVDCLQVDNTDIVPACATLYRCGLTVFPSPRGYIKKLAVIDKINPDTGKEDADSPDDWCSEIPYRRVDICQIESYFQQLNRCGGCSLPVSLFFGLSPCGKSFPVPTDEGLPTGLADLKLGYHYAQLSTDSPNGRALSGVWAMDRKNIFLAPWIQSTESVILKWDGEKRQWADGDLVDDDPLLKTAVEEYLRWQHASKFDRDEAEAARAEGAYAFALAKLIRQCREETRDHTCEPSHAGSSLSLFYNEEQTASAECPAGSTGTPVTVTIPAGTVASPISVNDANRLAKDEAQEQATDRLDCTEETPTFTNDEQTYTASCTVEEGAPLPEGSPVTVTVPAGTVPSPISKADANAKALLQAQTQADGQLVCTYWNRAVSYTASCLPPSTGTDVTVGKAAHTYSSPASQSDADATATNAAKTEAEAALVCAGGNLFWNTEQRVSKSGICPPRVVTNPPPPPCAVAINVTVPANRYSSQVSQADANQQAINAGNAYANTQWTIHCFGRRCGEFSYTLPG